MSELNQLINIDVVLPYLRCNNCGEFFKGDTVYGCVAGHTMCSLCRREARGPICKVEGCDKAAAAAAQGQSGNLAAMVRDLGLAVPCQNRGAGCGEKASGGGAIGEHEVECGFRKVCLLSH